MKSSIENNVRLLDAVLSVEDRVWGKACKLPAALRITQKLEPAGGFQVPIYPASYAGKAKNDPPVYDLNGPQRDGSGKGVTHYLHCVIDSYQSQANRMEPAFASAPLNELVPQITITIPRKKDANADSTTDSISALKIAHRVADFRIRLSDQHIAVKSWIEAFDSNDALPLIRNLPTSILFGFWDSRGDLGTKHSRILLSRIDAYDVVPCGKKSVYSGMYSKDEFLSLMDADNENFDEKVLSERGFTNALDSEGLGGVIVRGGILRTSTISLTDIAKITCNDSKELTNAARRYLFSLGVLAESFQTEMGTYNLRSGCELVPLEESTYELRGGKPNIELLSLCNDTNAMVEIAKEAAGKLGISFEPQTWVVSKESLKANFQDALDKKAKKKATKKRASNEKES